MSDSNQALVLHLVSGGEPIVFALSEKSAKSLRNRIGVLMGSAGVDTLELADGNAVNVNFGHVVTAHLDELDSRARVYGSTANRGHGFGA